MPARLDWPARRRLGTLALAAALALAALPLTALSDRFDPRRRPEPPERILYLPRGDTLKYLCLGYRGLAADLVFARSVLYIGRRLRLQDRNFEWLEKLFQVTTDLDPHWTRAYIWGDVLLTALPMDDARALRLLHKGMAANPGDYRFPAEMAALHIGRGRGAEALRWLRLIQRAYPEKPPEVRDNVAGLIASLGMEGGLYQEALASAAAGLAGTGDRVMRQVLARTYREALARYLCWELSAQSKRRFLATGRLAGSVRELVSAGTARRLAACIGPGPARSVLERLPADPYGMSMVLTAQGPVRSRGLDRLETYRALRTVNGFLEIFEKKHGRPAALPRELLEDLAASYASGAALPGMRAFFGDPPRLPPLPASAGRPGRGWDALEFRAGRFLMPPGPTIEEMLSAELELPPGPGDRARAGAPPGGQAPRDPAGTTPGARGDRSAAGPGAAAPAPGPAAPAPPPAPAAPRP